MAADPTAVGLFLVKLNGIFELTVKAYTFDVKRVVNQDATGGGIAESTGMEMASGSLTEIIPRVGATGWRALRNFSIEILDFENRSSLAKATGCNWESLGFSGDQNSAKSEKKIAWKGQAVANA